MMPGPFDGYVTTLEEQDEATGEMYRGFEAAAHGRVLGAFEDAAAAADAVRGKAHGRPCWFVDMAGRARPLSEVA